MSTSQQIKADLALVAITCAWGVTFVLVQQALSGIGPYYFIGLRFTIAFGFLALIYWKRLAQLDWSTLKAGLIIGSFLFGGYAFQTVGLKYTTVSNSGFITGLSVVLVPITTALLNRKPPGLITTLGVVSATLGLGLLSLGDNLTVNLGDVLTFFSALSYAGQIILVGKYASRHDPILLAILQIGVVALISMACGAVGETFPQHFTKPVRVGLLITAIPATAIAFLVQNLVQRYTSPTHTAIIFIMEPVFAAGTAWLLTGEMLTGRQWVGCLLILAGMLVTELKDALTSETAPVKTEDT